MRTNRPRTVSRAGYTLGTYGHVIDELDDQPLVSAEAAIRAARASRDSRRAI